MKLSVSYLNVKKGNVPDVLSLLDTTNIDFIHVESYKIGVRCPMILTCLDEDMNFIILGRWYIVKKNLINK